MTIEHVTCHGCGAQGYHSDSPDYPARLDAGGYLRDLPEEEQQGELLCADASGHLVCDDCAACTCDCELRELAHQAATWCDTHGAACGCARCGACTKGGGMAVPSEYARCPVHGDRGSCAQEEDADRARALAIEDASATFRAAFETHPSREADPVLALESAREDACAILDAATPPVVGVRFDDERLVVEEEERS